MFRRIIVLIMDSVGIGAQPDAGSYLSVGAHTFGHSAQSLQGFHVPNLQKLGLGNIQDVIGIPKVDTPMASFGRMLEISAGNDTFAGLWEMAGIVFTERFESFQPKLPDELILQLQNYLQIGTLCNSYISGFKVFDLFADAHFSRREPIVYTGDDGVVLVAAHEEVIAPQKLFEIAEKMSEFFIDKKVARIIARAFVGTKGSFIRTNNRLDKIIPFSKKQTHLFQRIKESEFEFTVTEHLASIIGSEFVTKIIPGVKDTKGVMDDVNDFISKNGRDLAMFVVPDFDMSGHARKPMQYAKDLMYFDERLGETLGLLNDDDCLIIVADHGCDPTLEIRGHTREYVPLLVYNRNNRGRNLGTRYSFSDLGQSICSAMKLPAISRGISFELTQKNEEL